MTVFTFPKLEARAEFKQLLIQINVSTLLCLREIRVKTNESCNCGVTPSAEMRYSASHSVLNASIIVLRKTVSDSHAHYNTHVEGRKAMLVSQDPGDF